MTNDPFAELKQRQRENGLFADRRCSPPWWPGIWSVLPTSRQVIC
jgi:hypothetical protein